MIERRLFGRFYAVFWRVGVGKKGAGSWNYTATDTRTGTGITGVVKGLSQASFREANAKVTRWAMQVHNASAAASAKKRRSALSGTGTLLVLV